MDSWILCHIACRFKYGFWSLSLCLLYNGYRVIPGVKRPGRGVHHPPPSSAEVKERVELYLYSPSGPSWLVLRRTLPLPVIHVWLHVSTNYTVIFRSFRQHKFQNQNCKLRLGSDCDLSLIATQCIAIKFFKVTFYFIDKYFIAVRMRSQFDPQWSLHFWLWVFVIWIAWRWQYNWS
jgi:hypothetical protein